MTFTKKIMFAVFFIGVTSGIPIDSESPKVHGKSPILLAETFGDILKINAYQGNFFEGDIVLQKEKNAIQDKTLRWDTTVPYEINGQFSFDQKRKIIAGLQELEVRTCLKFVERNAEENYMMYEKRSGCYSNVGLTGGKQIISIGNGCDYHRTIIHETLHALGFWHEQSRTDRDDNVEIVWENIIDGQESNFDKYDEDKLDMQGVPYDYSSIMHYSDTAFSKNGSRTIIPLKEGGDLMGRIDAMSQIDVQELNMLYECEETLDADGFTDWTTWTSCDISCEKTRQRFCDGVQCAQWGEVQTQTTACGAECEVGYDPDCGEKLLTSPTGSVRSPLYPHSYKAKSLCSQTIQVSEGARVQLIFQDMDVEDWGGSCYYDFVHVYDGADEAAPKIGTYCSTDLPPTLLSSGNALTIQFTSDTSIEKGGFYATYYATYAPEHACEFEDENDKCGWTDDAAAELTFLFHTGGTGSIETGPSADHTFGDEYGHYLYLEASSPAVNGNRARIISSTFRRTMTSSCFSFYYNMYGINTGSLNVYMETNDVLNETPIVTLSGDKGNNDWYQSRTTVTSSNDFKLVIEAVRGNGYKGDIGIDDVKLQAGQCIY